MGVYIAYMVLHVYMYFYHTYYFLTNQIASLEVHYS